MWQFPIEIFRIFTGHSFKNFGTLFKCFTKKHKMSITNKTYHQGFEYLVECELGKNQSHLQGCLFV